MLEAVGLLPAPELESDLARMLHEVEDLSSQLGIARNLVRITGDPGRIRECVHRMRASCDANLKEAHFGDIRFLPPNEQLDFYFDLLRDPDSPSVRHQALRELNELHDRKHYQQGALPEDAAYFQSRRDDPRFRAKLVEGVAAARSLRGA